MWFLTPNSDSYFITCQVFFLFQKSIRLFNASYGFLIPKVVVLRFPKFIQCSDVSDRLAIPNTVVWFPKFIQCSDVSDRLAIPNTVVRFPKFIRSSEVPDYLPIRRFHSVLWCLRWSTDSKSIQFYNVSCHLPIPIV